MKRIKLNQGLLIVLLLFLNLSSSKVYSEENQSSPLFSVQAVLPENQIKSEVSYFDLAMEPGKHQVVEVELINSGTSDLTILMEANKAATNSNGIIDYSLSDQKNDASLLIDFSKIVSIKNEVTISAGERMRVPVSIELPDKKFDGILLGALSFTEKVDKESQNQISNRYAYSIAMILSQNKMEVQPNLNLSKIFASQTNLRNVIKANLQNDQSIIVPNLEIETSIYRKNATKPLVQQKSENLRMAPNSNFDYSIGTNNKPLEAGNYRMEMKAKSNENEWTWSEEFTIAKEEADKYNETAVELEENQSHSELIIAALIGCILLLTFILFIKQKK